MSFTSGWLSNLIHGQERRRRVALLRRWVEANWDEATTIEDLVAKRAEVPGPVIANACDRKVLNLSEICIYTGVVDVYIYIYDIHYIHVLKIAYSGRILTVITGP